MKKQTNAYRDSRKQRTIAQFGEAFKNTFNLDLGDYFYHDRMFDVSMMHDAIFGKHNINLGDRPISFNGLVEEIYGQEAVVLIDNIIDFQFK